MALHAGVIRGTVVENYTGNSLARTIITLQPIGATATPVMSMRTNYAGTFEFASLAAGAYIIRATRPGFLPTEYGQRQWNSAGTPVVLGADGQAFLNIRLHRFGGITGTVRDENDIGLPGHDIVAYKSAEPPQLATRAKSDDRGVYRITGLEPGMYIVRTIGNGDGEISYVPTFSKQTLRVEDAQPVQVYADEDSKNIDVHPVPGRLFNLSGLVSPVPDGFSVTVTLASDMGRRTSEGPGFQFGGLPPGAYELYAEAREGPPGAKFLGGYTRLTLDHDMNGFILASPEVRETQFDISGLGRAAASTANRPGSLPITMRRKDLAGVGAAQPLQLTNNHASIPPGRWELSVTPPAGSYVSQFSPSVRPGRYRPDAWNEIMVQGYSYVRIGLSGGASALHGIVKAAGEPVAGAPVFLEAWDPDTHKRLTELRSTRTALDGTFRIESLAPGTYRVAATFEYLTPDSAALDLAGAHTVQVEGHADLQVALDLSGIR